MIDLVSAYEFTFTPSAFIAAYIEQSQNVSVTDTTTNGGSLVINPNDLTVDLESATGAASTNTNASANSVFTVGQNVANGNIVGITGDISSVVGQTTSDTRTSSKTTTTITGTDGTVVLVLSYGQMRAKCVNAQLTVDKIYQEVSTYLNSL